MASLSRLRDFNLTDYYLHDARNGPAIWKFAHYLPVYEKHFGRFRGTDVHFLEVGIHSGGSLRLWREFFGERAVIFGMDRLNATRIYQGDPRFGSPQRIFVGDQGSPTFWRTLKERVPRLDILLDDGGHQQHLMTATATAMIPHLSFGGVYLCEDLADIHFADRHPGMDHSSSAQLEWFFSQFARPMLPYRNVKPVPHSKGDYSDELTSVQRTIASLSFYPFQVVIEKRTAPLESILNEEHRGTFHLGSSEALFAHEMRVPELKAQYRAGHVEPWPPPAQNLR